MQHFCGGVGGYISLALFGEFCFKVRKQVVTTLGAELKVMAYLRWIRGGVRQSGTK